MEIKNMFLVRKPDSKIKAFFSVETKNFTINDCKLVEGAKGIFPAMPSREYVNKNGEKKYQPIIYIKDIDFLTSIGEEAVKEYCRLTGQNSKSSSTDSPDDDIPF